MSSDEAKVPEIVLIYPPACDPTAPYLSVPALTGFLRHHDVDVLPIDANAEGFDWLLQSDRLRGLRDRLEARLERLERKGSLDHGEQLLYASLWQARGDASAAPDAIDDAVAVLRDRTGTRFYDPSQYAGAIAAVESALRLVSAAYAPLLLTFTAYRTPFSLLDLHEVESDAREERDPFHGFFAHDLVERVRNSGAGVVGISVAFPGQIQPAYSLAHHLKRALPGVHLTAGGPALTQLLQGVGDDRFDRARGPFDSIVTYEGEHALLSLVEAVRRGERPPQLIRGKMIDDLGELPAPDFDGLDLRRYLTPELILPYDPTRGCYWGRCTFCHYGLAEIGTARYRERPVSTIIAHANTLSKKHGVRLLYFSQDAVNPKTALKVARAVVENKLPWRWSTDMRPERSLTPQLCSELKDGGALSMAVGVESASPRVLGLIDKGVPVETVRAAIRNLSGAGIGVEAMCFTDFPTESYQEAISTVRFVGELATDVSLFICGEFDLTRGSLVAQSPCDFGIDETWHADGDELGLGLFYRERTDPKNDDERALVDDALGKLSQRWWLTHYPWAGALSTAHTMLWYDHFGIDCFRRFSDVKHGAVPSARPRTARARFDVAAVMQQSAENDGRIWDVLVNEQRRVGRAAWKMLADKVPAIEPSPSTWRYLAGQPPQRASAKGGRGGNRRRGRRPSHAHNATKAPVRGWT